MDIDWIDSKAELFSLSGYINYSFSNSTERPIIWFGKAVNSALESSDIDFRYFRFDYGNYKQAIESFHGSLENGVCQNDVPARKYFSGCGENYTVLSTSLANPNGTTGYMMLNELGLPVTSYFFDFNNSVNGFNNFCTHNLVVDNVGFFEGPLANDRTTHSFIMPGNGSFEIGPQGGGIIAQTTNPAGTVPIPAQARSYRIMDGNPPNIPRSTRFYDGAMDLEQDGKTWRDKHAVCSDWRALIVGEKYLSPFHYGLLMEVNDALNPLWTKVLIMKELDELGVYQDLNVKLTKVVNSYSAFGQKDGYFIVGEALRILNDGTKSEYLLYLKTTGCYDYADQSNPLQIDFLQLVKIPTGPGANLDINSIQQLEDGSYRVLVSRNRLIQNDHCIVKVTVSGLTESVLRLPIDPDGTSHMVDFLMYPRQAAEEPNYIFSGVKFNSTSQPGRLILRQSMSTTETCGMTEVEWNYVINSYQFEPRFMAEFTEELAEVEPIPIQIEQTKTIACSTESACESIDNDDKMVLWNSHFDRGFGLSLLGDEVVTTGLMAGPWRKPTGEEPSSPLPCRFDCIGNEQSTNIVAERNMDCSFTITDRLYAEPNARHG